MPYEIVQAWHDCEPRHEVLARAVDVDGLFSSPVHVSFEPSTPDLTDRLSR